MKRKIIGVIALAVVTLVGLYDLRHGRYSPASVMFALSCMWGSISYWIGGVSLMHERVGEIYAHAKRGGLKLTRFALATWWASILMFIAWLVLLIAR